MGLLLRHRGIEGPVRQFLIAFAALLIAGCATSRSKHYDICRVQSVEIVKGSEHREEYLTLCGDDAGRSGFIIFKKPVMVGDEVHFTAYQVNEDTSTYYGYFLK